MRTLSGSRNRLALVLAGLLALLAAAWLAAVAFDLVAPGTALGGLVVPAESTVAAVVQDHRGWLLPAASVAAVLAVLAGLGLAAVQFPKAPAHTVLRFHDSDGTVLATLDPQVLERALVERVEAVPGVVEVSLRVSGSAAALRVVGEVAVSDGAEVEWAVDQTRQLLASDVETVLGRAPQTIDLLVRLRSPRTTSRSDRVAVGQPAEARQPVPEPA